METPQTVPVCSEAKRQSFLERVRSIFCRPAFTDAFHLFETQILCFPVVVTVLTSLTLLLGGRCSAWLWWISVLAICLWGGVVAKTWRRGLLSVLSFLFLLMGIWFVAGLSVTVGWMDTLTYHLPAIRLLIEGWNPIYASTPETLAQSIPFDPWEMRLWHVLSMPKSTWYFSAEAYFFTGAARNLLFPLFPFLFLATLFQLRHLLRGCSLPWKALVFFVYWTICPRAEFSIVDATIFMSAVGLLTAMGRILKGEAWDWKSLLVYSFWLTTAKPTGLLSCFVFWAFFALLVLWQDRQRLLETCKRLALLALGIASLFCVTCASPYFTMWANYGHPFYPKYSVAPETHPVYNFTADFDRYNEDTAAMGHVGRLMNAYVSPSLTKVYYKWKLGKETFEPRSSTWSQGGDNGFDSDSPTKRSFRILFLLSALAIFLLGGRTEKLLGVLIIAGISFVPTSMIGYTRYIGWVNVMPILAFLAIGHCSRLWVQKSLFVVCLIPVGFLGLTCTLSRVSEIDSAFAAQQLLRNAPPVEIFSYYSGGLPASTLEELYVITPKDVTGDPTVTSMGNIKLLCKQEPALRLCRILPLKLLGEDLQAYPTFPGGDFKMAPNTPTSPSLFMVNASLPDRKQRLMSYPKMMLEICFIRLPKLIGWRIQSLWE